MSTYCQCPLAGFCERHGIRKTKREWQLCQGEAQGVCESTADTYRRAWDDRIMPGQDGSTATATVTRAASGNGKPIALPSPREKVGSELARLIKWFVGVSSGGCSSCSNYAKTMDAKGADWCEANIDTIVRWMHEGASKKKVLGFSLDSVPGFDMGAKALVSKAIKAARENAAASQRNRSLGKVTLPTKSPVVRQPLDRSLLVKHFVFHMLPLSDHGGWVWRRHVERIRSVLHLFNGKVIVSVAGRHSNRQEIVRPFTQVKTTLRFDTLDAVEAAFGDDAARIEFIAVNNTVAGEGVSFPLLMERILSDDPNHVFCYAHSKGGTHPELPPSNPCHRWSDAMWETVVENQDLAIDALDAHAVAGSFLRVGNFHGGWGCKFHYSGTFWWGRCSETSSKKWRKVPKYYGNIEMWPGNQWGVSDAACLFTEVADKSAPSLYDAPHWDSVVEPALREWRLQKR